MRRTFSKWRSRLGTCLPLAFLSLSLAGTTAPAQLRPAPTPGTSGGTTSVLRGVVFDSLGNRRLPGAFVQVVSDGATPFVGTATTDAFGVYLVESVPAGRYTVGFQHPLLDSLGIEAPARVAVVRDAESVTVDLAIPSPARLRRTICGAAPGAVVIGFVRDVRGNAAIGDATVAGEWIEYALGRTGVMATRPRRASTTFPTGFFALCQVPSPGAVVLRASKGSDSTGAVEVAVTETGFVRQDLVLGKAGAGRLAGTVTRRDGTPLIGAQISIIGGPSVRTTGTGDWLLTGAPSGTQSLEVRAVGFYPERRTLTVSASTPRIDARLETLKAVLDTMKVVANLAPSVVAEFNTRRRTLNGRFLGPEDIVRRGPTQVSDLFKSIQGVYLEVLMPSDTVSQFNSGAVQGVSGDTQLRITMRGGFSEKCLPPIWLNGMQLNDITAADIDGLAQPGDLIGIEVYQATQVPAQFRTSMNGCGAVVIWRRR